MAVRKVALVYFRIQSRKLSEGLHVYPIELLSIEIIVVLVICAAIWSFFVGPRSPFAQHWRQQARELEVKVRMGAGGQVVEDLRALAKLYFRLGKRWDAEQALRRAWNICEQHAGEGNASVLPIMEEFARLMDGMHRRGEAKNVRKRINEIKQQRAQK